MNTRKLFSLTALSLLLTAGAHAQMASPMESSAQAASGSHLAVGVVRSVSAEARTVSIAHQAIAGMGMPAMTMSFRVDEGVATSSIKARDTVAFVLTSTPKGAVISSIQSVVVAAAGDKPAAQGMPGMSKGAQGMQGMQGMQMMDECREMMSKK